MDADAIRDLFAVFGPVGVQRLFGGAGIYAEGMMFALVSDGVIYLKTDADGAARFAREGSAAFGYDTREGRRALTSYWRLPDRLYDDPEELAEWARRAVSVARSRPVRRPSKGDGNKGKPAKRPASSRRRKRPPGRSRR